ncbi:hypothetical protein ACQ4PT_009121 [Festuca glaucescens]
MSHHHHQEQHNAAEVMEEDDYNMDDDSDGDDFLGQGARNDSDSDEEEGDDDEYAQGDYKASDTSAEEARRGKDIQGIPWVRLATTREKYRARRLVEYKNYENIPNSTEAALKLCKSTEKGGMYYEFSRNTRKVKSTILHFQIYWR